MPLTPFFFTASNTPSPLSNAPEHNKPAHHDYHNQKPEHNPDYSNNRFSTSTFSSTTPTPHLTPTMPHPTRAHSPHPAPNPHLLPPPGRTNTHHCPERGKGNCRQLKVNRTFFCSVHQVLCTLDQRPHLASEPCIKCETRLTAPPTTTTTTTTTGGTNATTAPEPAPTLTRKEIRQAQRVSKHEKHGKKLKVNTSAAKEKLKEHAKPLRPRHSLQELFVPPTEREREEMGGVRMGRGGREGYATLPRGWGGLRGGERGSVETVRYAPREVKKLEAKVGGMERRYGVPEEGSVRGKLGKLVNGIEGRFARK